MEIKRRRGRKDAGASREVKGRAFCTRGPGFEPKPDGEVGDGRGITFAASQL